MIARSPAPLTLNFDHTQISMETEELALPSATEVHCTTPCPCCLRSPARVDVLSSRQPRSLRLSVCSSANAPDRPKPVAPNRWSVEAESETATPPRQALGTALHVEARLNAISGSAN